MWNTELAASWVTRYRDAASGSSLKMWCSGDSLESKRRRSEMYSTEITGTHNYGGKK